MTNAPPPATQSPDQPTAASRRPAPIWRRTAAHPAARTAFGLAVLAAIVGGLVAFDRLSGDNDGDRLVEVQPGQVELVPEEAGVGPLDGRAPQVGQPAPDFALRDPDGNLHRLSDYRGSLVWVNFWATWCDPCKRELPDIQRLHDELEDRGLVVLEVNRQESAERALGFWRDLELDLPILLDRSGAVFDQYRLRGLPDSFFIDRDGVLRAVQVGFLTEDEMRDKLVEAGLEP